MNESNRFIHSLMNHKLFANHLLYVIRHRARWCWGKNHGEFKRTSLHHHGASSLVGKVDVDQESHVKKCKMETGSACRESISNRGLTWSE